MLSGNVTASSCMPSSASTVARTRWRYPDRRRCTARPGRTRLPPLHLVHQLHGQDGARRADRVPQGDGAAVGVDLVEVHAQRRAARRRNRGERLVELDDVDLVLASGRPCAARSRPPGLGRTHDLGAYASLGLRRPDAASASAPALRLRGVITTTAAAPSLIPLRVARRDPATSLKAGASLPSASIEVSRGCSSCAIVTVSRPLRTSIGRISSTNLPAAIAAAARSWLRSANSSCVSRATSYSMARFSAVIPMWVLLKGSLSTLGCRPPASPLPSGAGAGVAQVVGQHRHVLGAAGHDDLRVAALDPARRRVDRLKPGAADAVHRVGRHLDRQPRLHGSVARDVAVFRHLPDAAQDHLVDVVWRNTGRSTAALITAAARSEAGVLAKPP